MGWKIKAKEIEYQQETQRNNKIVIYGGSAIAVSLILFSFLKK